MYDAAIIGAGVVGSAIARELSKYNINACVIEKMRMYAAAHQKQTAPLSMPAMMPPRAL